MLITSKPSDASNNKKDAFVMSQMFAGKHLKLPPTASFCTFQNANITELDEKKFKITAHVDTKNSLGNKKYIKYTCIIIKTDDKNWHLENFVILTK